MSALATELRALADLHRAREDGAVLQHMHSMRAVYRMREKDIELAIVAVEAFDLLDSAALADDDELKVKLGHLRDVLVERARGAVA